MDSHLHRTVHMVLVSLRGIARTGIHSPDNGMELKSPAFDRGELIPKVYTRQGKDISPPLEWSGSPEGTRSFALICDDPDAPLLTWVHWVYYNIPATCTSLPEAIAKTEYPGQGGIQGRSSYGEFGYGGPCPPWGIHRYFFRLFALDTVLNLQAGSKKRHLMKAMEGHVLATTEIMGTYKKQ